jgi:hypothetical protein
MTNIVPFGKYKGHPVEVLAADHAYCDWLVAQAWFRERYGNFYTLIVNNFAEPSETPEHNALQARFLDGQLCRKLFRAVIDSADKDIKISTDFEVHGWDVLIRAGFPDGSHKYILDRNFYIEIKPSLGDDYPAILRQMKANWRHTSEGWGRYGVLVFDQFTAAGASLDQVRAIFAAAGFRVLALGEIEHVSRCPDVSRSVST